MAPTQWLLVAVILGFDLIALIVIARSPRKSTHENTYNPAPNEDQFPQLLNGHRVKQVVSRPRRVPKPFVGLPKSLNPFRRKGPHARRKHRLHHRHYAFLLRCPQPPQENLDQVSTKTQIGVEFSHNDLPLIRILSDGRRFESEEISAVEEWKTVHNRLNIVAHGPRGESRYKFEFDEARGWYAVRIVELKPADVGLWQCRAKLRHKNGTIQQFDSRKTIRMSDVPMEQRPTQVMTALTTPVNTEYKMEPIIVETTTENPKTVETTTVDIAVEMGFVELNDRKASEGGHVISYSDPPLFSFAKPIGDPMFSRVDRRRDVFIAYVRTDDPDEDTQPESQPKRPPRKRQRKAPSNSSMNLPLFYVIALILIRL